MRSYHQADEPLQDPWRQPGDMEVERVMAKQPPATMAHRHAHFMPQIQQTGVRLMRPHAA